MRWTNLSEGIPTDFDLDYMIWGEGWRCPAVASLDPETGEFFDPQSYTTHIKPTHWLALPARPSRRKDG